MKQFNKKATTGGFTLIELFVVIAIIAILSVVVILTLNPTELLKQARDSNRISDLSTLKSAISLYLSDVTTPSLVSSTALFTGAAACTNGGTITTGCYSYCFLSTQQGAANGTTAARCGGTGNGYQSVASPANVSTTQANNRKVDGSGWVPVRFTDISSGAPVGNLPVDPTNNSSFYYSYAATGTSLTFEIMAYMESNKYASSSANIVGTQTGGC